MQVRDVISLGGWNDVMPVYYAVCDVEICHFIKQWHRFVVLGLCSSMRMRIVCVTKVSHADACESSQGILGGGGGGETASCRDTWSDIRETLGPCRCWWY